MPEEPIDDLSPADFPGNFAGYIAHLQGALEAELGNDAGQFENVEERAQAEAQFIAAKNWLIERWGEHFPCPICDNTEWVVSRVLPAIRPPGFFSFHVTCQYCGNTIQVVPGRAQMDAPLPPDQQLHFPSPQ